MTRTLPGLMLPTASLIRLNHTRRLSKQSIKLEDQDLLFKE
jgi:hypothetical protein